jgi:hypothetical protein
MVNVLESPYFRDQFMRGLAQSVWRGQETSENITEKLVILIANRLWAVERVDSNSGEKIPPFESFSEFVVAPLTRGGLDTTIEILKRLCQDDLKALHAIDAALAGEDITIPKSPEAMNGSKEGDLRRLRRERSDLHKQVVRGELSVNAAMLQAGFRTRKISINTDDMESAANTLVKHLDPEKLTDLLKYLKRKLRSS